MGARHPFTQRSLREDSIPSYIPSSVIPSPHTTFSSSTSKRSFSLSHLLVFVLATAGYPPFSLHPNVVAAAVTPTWRAFHGAAIVDTSMIIFGGTVDPNVNPFDSTVSGSNDLWVWSTTLRQWSQPKPEGSINPPNPQKFLTSVPLQSQGKMMALISNSTTGSTQTDLIILDTNFWTWSIPNSPNGASAPASRLGAAIGISDNTVYVHGGTSSNSNGYAASSGALNDLNKLDDSTFEWTSIANGPALMYHTMCKLPGVNKMVVFGGSDTASNAFNDVHTIDLGFETWSLNVRVEPGLGGGGGADGPLDDDVWVMDASKTQWVWNRMTTNKQMGPGPRTGHSALLNGTNILIWGGYGAPLASDINIYILDTLTWQWSSSKEVRGSSPPPSTAVPSNPTNSKNNLPVTIGVVCACIALIAAFVGFLVFRRRASKKAQGQVKRAKDNASYLSDAEQYLSREMSLDDKPAYYNQHSGRDSGSSLGGWPSTAGRKNIPSTAQGYPMRSMSTLGQQAAATAADTSTAAADAGSSSEQGAVVADTTQSLAKQSPKPTQLSRQISLQDVDQISQRTGVRVGSIASDPFYPAHLAENDEEDADRWTFASSLSFDQREKVGPIPTLRYIPTRGSGMPGIQRSMVQSSGNLVPSYSAARGVRRDVSAPSILSGKASSIGGAPSIILNPAGPNAQPLSRDGSIISPREATLFNSVSPLDRVSLMCSGLDVESQVSGEDDHLSTTHLHSKGGFPQWQDSYRRESCIGATVEEEIETHVTLQRSGSSSTANSSGVYTTLEHPALATLIQNLPARYLVSKSPSPIHGTFNDILFAVDSDTQQPIVIKSFSRREAWERECRVLKKLRGPCVVELKHVATLVLSETDDPNKPATIRLTILERLDETLAQMLKNARKAKKLALREQAAGAQGEHSLDLSGAGLYRSGPALDESYVKDIVKGVLRCLTWCHSKKIVYCDLKPTNIMRNRDDPRQQWKLIDLESSRTAEEERMSVGTVRYCPPEVAKATVAAKESTGNSTAGVTAHYSMDLWAFGCLLYELFATRPLIPKKAKDDVVLHFLAHPSVDTPPLSNGLRWTNTQELEIPYFEEAVRNKSARQLIRMLLRPDPKDRAVMDEILDSEYLSSEAEKRILGRVNQKNVVIT
ncbi:hypothetical protein BX616_002381 [Lobosporangium transversale]|nr:hypothetical protein BX616_002381 [Lobosporangium transversale]